MQWPFVIAGNSVNCFWGRNLPLCLSFLLPHAYPESIYSVISLQMQSHSLCRGGGISVEVEGGEMLGSPRVMLLKSHRNSSERGIWKERASFRSYKSVGGQFSFLCLQPVIYDFYSYNHLAKNMPCSKEWVFLSYIFTRVFYICVWIFLKIYNLP